MAQENSASATGTSGRRKKKVGKKKAVAKLAAELRANDISIGKNTSEADNSATVNTLVRIALGISLIALVIGGYSWYRNIVDSRIQLSELAREQASEQSGRIAALDQRLNGFQQIQTDIGAQISQLKGQVLQAEEFVANQVRAMRKEMVDQRSTFSGQIADAESSRQAREAQFRQEFETLSGSIVSIRAELGKNVDNWRLQEAEQLIFMANQRLQLMGDVAMAIKALKFADRKLRDLGGPAVTEVRQHLSNEIARLEQVEQLDVIGIAAAISALSTSLGRLPLPGDAGTFVSRPQSEGGPAQGESGEATQVIEETGAGSLISAGKSFFSELGDLIQVEKNGRSVKPIISAEIKFLTIEKARLILESAQIAFLKRQYPLFRQRMSDAGNWVEERFDLQSGETARWLEQLSSLSQVPAQTELPDISQSLESIGAVIHREG